MAFGKTFDEILNNILTDFRNIFPSVDVSQGSLAYMKAAGYASALWGLYKYQEWISRQIFPDTASTEALEHHAWLRDITRRADEDDAALLARVLFDIRNPPAGGTANDYIRWATSIDGVGSAYCFPLEDWSNTVMVVVVADTDTGSETPSPALLAEVAAYIDEVRPVTALVSVQGPTWLATNIAMTITGTGVDLVMVAADIEAYLNGFVPGQILYPARLAAIAIEQGAENALVTDPAGAVVPGDYEIIRPGVINVV